MHRLSGAREFILEQLRLLKSLTRALYHRPTRSRLASHEQQNAEYAFVPHHRVLRRRTVLHDIKKRTRSMWWENKRGAIDCRIHKAPRRAASPRSPAAEKDARAPAPAGRRARCFVQVSWLSCGFLFCWFVVFVSFLFVVC